MLAWVVKKIEMELCSGFVLCAADLLKWLEFDWECGHGTDTVKFGVFPLLSVGALRGPAGTCGVSQHLNRDLMLDPLDLNNPKKEKHNSSYQVRQ